MSHPITTDDSLFFNYGDVKYTAWPTSFIDVLPEAEDDGPVAILPTQDVVNADWLKEFFDGSLDDVSRHEFAKGILLQPNGTAANFSSEAKALLKSWGNSWIKTLAVTVPPGPYFYKDNTLWQVLRLFDDHQGAFLVSLRPADDGAYALLNDGSHGWSCNSLAVLSRLTVKDCPEKPFAKWRIAVKDAFDVKGVKISMCNKAYLEVYPPATSTARSIIHILNGGASVLGKTKLNSFLSREEASESVDYQAAWNPRADGYQTTGASSSGSAAAVAAYEWIDVGIGTDTNGSIRRPAQCNGVFGLRPSQGVFPQDGMFTAFKTFDVPGIFARDLDKLASFATKWYGDRLPNESAEHLPPRILLPIDLLPEDETPQKSVVLDFLKDFETHMGINADRVSLSALWAENPPKEADGQTMHEYLEKVGRDTFLYANYHSTAAFRDQYLHLHGRQPFVSKFVRWRWSVGSKISKRRARGSNATYEGL
ncbi:MAG: hypothetical protein LQ350_003894 [Teloschistes chrysophthalmus]|nr:MAG: hypothetical protein LQ350_003894 [Niorma chrysophthalma]